MLCKKCGSDISETSALCAGCGASTIQQATSISPTVIRKRKKWPIVLVILLLYLLIIPLILGLTAGLGDTSDATNGVIAAVALLIYFFAPLITLLSLIGLTAYQFLYFRGEKFKAIKDSVQAHIDSCNQLNSHIEELKSAYVDIRHADYGQASYTDTSRHNYKRPELKKWTAAPNVHNCSLQVCNSARQQPFKYVCKYFGSVY
jgi:hypothetical protein